MNLISVIISKVNCDSILGRLNCRLQWNSFFVLVSEVTFDRLFLLREFDLFVPGSIFVLLTYV